MLKLFKKQNVNVSFIFGCPRGGTTWLWSLLESHKDIVPFTNGVEKDSDGRYATSESGVYVKDAKNAKKNILTFSQNNKGKVIIEKTPSHTLKYDLIKKDFPKSKDLVILRNPIAVVNSMYSSNMNAFADHSIEKSIIEVKMYFSALSKLIKRNSPYVITYEKLFEDTKKEYCEILQYLDVSIDGVDTIISENENKTKVSVSGAFRKGQVDSFKTDLTNDQIIKIEDKLKEEIIFFNNYR